MQIKIKNPLFEEDLLLKSQTIYIDSFFNELLIEASAEEIQSISYGEKIVTWKGGQLFIPCTLNFENKFFVLIEMPQSKIKLSIKLDEKQMIETVVTEDYANFMREYLEWSNGEAKTSQSITKAIQDGELSLLKMEQPMTGMEDDAILQQIEQTIPFLLEISARPRMHLRAEEEVLDIGLVKRINASTLQHLAAHSEHWHSRTITGLRPARLKAEVYEDDYNIYENIFYRMLIEKIQAYLRNKGRKIAEAIDQKNEIADWETYANDMIDYRKAAVFKQILPTIDYSANEKQKDQFATVHENILRLEKKIGLIISSNFYQQLDRKKRIDLPVQLTNILTMEPSYHKAYKLWNVLHKRNEKNVKEGLDGETVQHIQIYYELYTIITLIYAIGLLGYDCTQSSLDVSHDGIDFKACYETKELSIFLTLTKVNQEAAINIELIEKLKERLIIPEKIGPLVSSWTNDGSIVFAELPTVEAQRELLNIVRQHIMTLTKTKQREWKKDDSSWRESVTAFFQSFTESRTKSMMIVPIFNEIGDQQDDIAKITSNLLDSLPIDTIACMPFQLNLLKINDDRYWSRLQSFGEAFHKEDNKWGNYKKGLFSVSQMDFHSIQRLMKYLFIFEHRTLMNWEIAYETCPSCATTDILKTEERWKCRDKTCGLVWGFTKCTAQCQQYFAWMRPDIAHIEPRKSEGIEALKEKEFLFGYTVVTDFEIRNQDGIAYIPICPTCGKKEKTSKEGVDCGK